MRVEGKLLVSVVGPTAVGKTSFAIALARAFETEILSVDSRQCYREMNIGTAKPNSEELESVSHHFIDSHSIREQVTAGSFEKLAMEKLDEIFQETNVVVAVGGSGLYFQALWGGMDHMPAVDPVIRESLNDELESRGLEPLLKELKDADLVYFEKVDQQNPHRILRALEVIRGSGQPYSSFRAGRSAKRSFENLKIGLTMDRDKLYQRIDQRMDDMIEAGLFKEAESLIEYREHNALQTVGYSEVFGYLDGKYDREEAIRLLKRNSRRYAKRQFTWFNRDPEIIWMSPAETSKAIDLIRKRLGV